MARDGRRPVWSGLIAPFGWIRDRFRRRGGGIPPAGVREPRRPTPTLPAGAVALDEPRTRTRRVRLTSRRDKSRGITGRPGDRMAGS